MTIKYADDLSPEPIVLKEEGNPKPRLTADGYTQRGGSPSRMKALFQGRWYRVYILQFSNAGSAVIKVDGEMLFLRDY